MASARRFVEVGDSKLAVLRHPLYSEAHPDEPCNPGDLCTECLVAKRLDTQEEVLLWLVGGQEWSVHRADPNYERHKQELQ